MDAIIEEVMALKEKVDATMAGRRPAPTAAQIKRWRDQFHDAKFRYYKLLSTPARRPCRRRRAKSV